VTGTIHKKRSVKVKLKKYLGMSISVTDRTMEHIIERFRDKEMIPMVVDVFILFG